MLGQPRLSRVSSGSKVTRKGTIYSLLSFVIVLNFNAVKVALLSELKLNKSNNEFQTHFIHHVSGWYSKLSGIESTRIRKTLEQNKLQLGARSFGINPE